MERVTISLDEDLLAEFDDYLRAKNYKNRSEGIRDAIRNLTADDLIKADDESPCVGCVVYVYNHQERNLSSRLVEAQHHHHHIPAATLHLHIDSENCLEATVLNGKVSEVRALANQIISQTGVRHGHLQLIPVDPNHVHKHSKG